MNLDYWRKQESDKPLFPDILWSKPERRDTAGKIAIVGGNAHGFAAVAASYQTALATGVGAARVILPDALKPKLPTAMSDAIFTPTNPSGGFASTATIELAATAEWANLILLIGDNGQNSETAGLFETFLAKHPETPVVITRDAVDLIKNAAESVLNRAPTHLVVSFSQLQKLFRAVYYPRVLTFSQGLKQVAETLHKFTITYPCAITLWHSGNLFVAHDGEVITQNFDQPMRVWSGEVATREAVWQIWQRSPLHAVASAWVELEK
jgi:NAD(P)H-hydrate repair Nnr-like enzyme with NAD(P)H-hydrate dehydratase domain